MMPEFHMWISAFLDKYFQHLYLMHIYLEVSTTEFTGVYSHIQDHRAAGLNYYLCLVTVELWVKDMLMEILSHL